VHSLAPSAPEYDPAAHVTHVPVVEAPVAAEADPAEQATHADSRLAPAFTEYFP
jgi:hypothetical protein